MLQFTDGNLLESDVEAVVNTVNTVGVMGKGIALMFKERFPDNFAAYAKACKAGQVSTGRMFVTENMELEGPRWIVNFPTKRHWRGKTQLNWIEEGLADLVDVIEDRGIRSIALPPLGCGNGGLDWHVVRPLIETALGSTGIDVRVFEPTHTYQNVAKRRGVLKLTPARALIADMVRRYQIVGSECSLLEVQKLAWFVNRGIDHLDLENPLQLSFVPHRYGPYSGPLMHLLNALDGSYLRSDKRLPDAEAFDPIEFDQSKKDTVRTYLSTGEGKMYAAAADWAESVVDGFQSPYEMELLATVDWLSFEQGVLADIDSMRSALRQWPGGPEAARRKDELFDDRSLGIALDHLKSTGLLPIRAA